MSKYLPVASGIIIALLGAAAPAQQTGYPKPAELPNPYRLVEGWPTLPASMNGGHWGEVIRVHVGGDGNIWVFHRCFNTVPPGHATCIGRGDSNPPILEFDPSGKLLKSFGAGLFAYPHGFTIARDGNLWVSDVNDEATVLGMSARNAAGVIMGQEVLKLSPTGKVLMTLGKEGVSGNGPDTFDRPTGVAVAPNGDVFVTDGHAPNQHNSARVVKFSKDGRFIKAWGHKGAAPGDFDEPHDIFIGGSQGHVYVADRKNNRIQVFDQDGKFIAAWKQFGQPSSVFVGKDDTIYVGASFPDPAAKKGELRGIVVGSAKDGSLKFFIPDPADPDKLDVGTSASGIAADDAGTIYAADVAAHNLRKYFKAGEAEKAQAQKSETLSIARQGYLFAGGKYLASGSGQTMSGQLYAEYQIPAKQTQPWPIVMIHGGAQTGTNFTGTPDGREGWAQFFLRKGFAVYVVDQAGRGRAAYEPQQYGPATRVDLDATLKRFVAPERFNLWPQAHLHTQWPGKGEPGDPVFDQFQASQVPSIENFTLQQTLNRDAIIALLEKIGPAILLTHSQSGAFGWPVADARVDLVKAILAVEPNGPPFYNVENVPAPEWYRDAREQARPWGITAAPLNYDPPVSSAAELAAIRQPKPDGTDLVPCWEQKSPPRQLPRLRTVPILILTSEASYHAPYDHCTVKYLEQAGVHPTWIKLADIGIRGNGHMMMLEKNNREIAQVMAQWLLKALRDTYPQRGSLPSR